MARIRGDLPGMQGLLGFRGEAAKYDHTFSLLYRIIHQQQIMPARVEKYLIDLLDEIAMKLHLVLNAVPLFRTAQEAIAQAKKRGPFDPIEVIGGFLQHYYLPTNLLDVTDSLELAVKFAAYPDSRYEDEVPHIAQIYVLNLTELKKNGREVFSLMKSKADRPRKQRAYSLPLAAGDDLQNGAHFPKDQVNIYKFETTNVEKKKFFDPQLMRARGDRVAKEVGYLIYQINERERDSANDDQKRVLHYLGQTVCGKLIEDEAHL
jgi:hypothetical protein